MARDHKSPTFAAVHHYDGYAIIKVFFSNLKRGGILLIQISGWIIVYVQCAPRVHGRVLSSGVNRPSGYALRSPAGDHPRRRTYGHSRPLPLGLGLMLSAGEVPRICGAFGLDTLTKANIMVRVQAQQRSMTTKKVHHADENRC